MRRHAVTRSVRPRRREVKPLALNQMLRTFAPLALISTLAAAASAQSMATFGPEVAIQNADYAQIRRTFHTTLIRRAGSPQHEIFVSLTPPDSVEEVHFISRGLRLKAWVAGHHSRSAKLPAVIFLHGGFEFGPADWDMARPYWEAGFVLMMPMLRGENGQPGNFSFFYDEVDDVLAAADYLRRQPGVDPANIFLAGHSAGATLALLAAETSPRFRAVASFDGSPDQQLLYNGKASKAGAHREIVFDVKDLRELEVRSPLAYAGSLKVPTRLYYSTEASPLFELGTEKFVEIARAHGINVAASGVNGSHMSHVAAALPQSIQFFTSELSPRSIQLLKPRSVPPLRPILTGNTTFRLTGHKSAKVVALAGSFNGWDSQHFLCGREPDGWICRVDLPPGKYLYKFVVDDDWIPDPGNRRVEDDGGGNTNSVVVVCGGSSHRRNGTRAGVTDSAAICRM